MDINDIINSLSSYPNFERRIKIAKLIKPIPTRFIYKYRAVNPEDHVSIDRLRDTLVRSKLWLSSSEAFNDPFDMSTKVDISRDGKKKREMFYKIAKGIELKYNDRKRFTREMMLKPHSEMEEVLQNTFEDSINKIGVFSFAGDPRSILMWSHYADNHRGICIQFESARDPQVVFRAVVPVQYTNEYPRVEYTSNYKESLRKVLLNKHEGWSYEKEERIILYDKANTYLSFSPDAITSVIFGCKASKDIIDAVSDLLDERLSSGKPAVKLYRAIQHKSQYKLEICSY